MVLAPLAVTVALALASARGGAPLISGEGNLLQWTGGLERAEYAVPTSIVRAGKLHAVATALVVHEGASPHADARVPACALLHRVRIIVASPISILETMRLIIDYAGSWELWRLLRSAGWLGPALGFFPDFVLLVLIPIVAHVLVITRCVHWPAILHHHGPWWQRDGEARAGRAASPLADWELARPVTAARPSSSPCTASSPIVLDTALGARSAFLCMARSAAGTLHNCGGIEHD